MAGIVATFKGLTLDEMIEAYPQITAALTAARDARRLQLEAEIHSLGFKPGEGKRPPPRPQSSIAAFDPSKHGRVAGLNRLNCRICHFTKRLIICASNLGRMRLRSGPDVLLFLPRPLMAIASSS
jgi:DNA-binding protein H-NS